MRPYDCTSIIICVYNIICIMVNVKMIILCIISERKHTNTIIVCYKVFYFFPV